MPLDLLPYLISSGAANTGNTTLAMTVGANNGWPAIAGDALIAVGGSGGTQASSVTDSQGNTYTKATISNIGASPVHAVFTATAGSSGLKASGPGITADTVTANYPGTGQAKQWAVVGCQGVVATPDSAVSAGANGTSAAPSVTSGTPGQPGELVIATVIHQNAAGATFVFDSGWIPIATNITLGANAYASVGYKINRTTSAVTASGTIASSVSWTASVVGLPMTSAWTNTRSIVGASIFSGAYPGLGYTNYQAKTAFDGFVSRVSANRGCKRYLNESQFESQANQYQSVVDHMINHGIFCVVSVKPRRVVGGGNTTDLANLRTMYTYWKNNGCAPHVVMGNEANINGLNGPFGSGATKDWDFTSPYGTPTATQAAINYQQWFAYYGPTAIAAGLQCQYNPAVSSSGTTLTFMPARLQSSGAPLCTGVSIDYYYEGDYGTNNITLTDVLNACNTASPPLPAGIGETGGTDGTKRPITDDPVGMAAFLDGQVTAKFQNQMTVGAKANLPILWYANGTGNTINGTTDSRVIAAYQRMFDALDVGAATTWTAISAVVDSSSASGYLLPPRPSPYQAGSGLTTGAGTSRTAAIGTATAAGDTLLLIITTNATGCTISSATDSKGNVYTLDGSTAAAVPPTYFFRSPGATGGPAGAPTVALTTSDTVTATSTAITGNVEVQVICVPKAGALDVVSSLASGTSTAPAASVTPTAADDIVVGGFGYANGGGAPTVLGPFALVNTYQSGVNPYNVATFAPGGAGGVAQTSTLTITSAVWRGIVWSFKTPAVIWTATGTASNVSSAAGVGITAISPPLAPVGFTAGAPPRAPGNVYRFLTTDTVTGAVLADSLPIVGQSAQRQINSVGSFSGALTLPVAGAPRWMVPIWLNALRPWRSILWIMQNGTPIWHGPITAWNHQSVGDGTLPIQAATIEEFFKHRQVDTNMVFLNMDVFEIFRQELLFALGKTPNGNVAGTGRYANQSGIVDTVMNSGVIGSITEADSLKKIYDCWGDLVTTYGLEYTLAPAITSAGSLFTQVQLGLPLLGRKFADTQLQFVFPSKGMVDYAWPWAPTGAANSLIVTGSGSGDNAVNYQVASKKVADGMPLLEESTSFSGTVASQAQIQQYADGLINDYSPDAYLNPSVVVADVGPQVSQVQLGDEAMFAMTSPIHPPDFLGRPGYMGSFRLTGWNLTFPTGQQTEETVYSFGAGDVFSLGGG